MRTSPKTMAIIYFIMGLIILLIAIQVTGNSVWSTPTVILAIMATLNFGVAIRLMSIHFRLKNKNKNKKE